MDSYALLLGSAAAGRHLGLRPRARVVASATTSTAPVIRLTAGEQVIAGAGVAVLLERVA